ncbi:hypothetical protein BaRGS_00014812 [Batillaria attramentaria]|uniref:Dystroglycan 1 n=1 Tax=Batillaria attramentaria TaxID=370345 RepID=A0ABD0L471_9CAEN
MAMGVVWHFFLVFLVYLQSTFSSGTFHRPRSREHVQHSAAGARHSSGVSPIITCAGKLLELHLDTFHVLTHSRTQLQDYPPWLVYDDKHQVLRGVATGADIGVSVVTAVALQPAVSDTKEEQAVQVLVAEIIVEGSGSVPHALLGVSASSGVQAEIAGHQLHTGTRDSTASKIVASDRTLPSSSILRQSDKLRDNHVVVASLVLCSSTENVDPAARVTILRMAAEFFSVSTSSFMWVTSNDGGLHFAKAGYRIMAGGAASDGTCTENKHSEMFWPLPATANRHMADFTRVFQHNVNVGRVREEIGISVIGWYLATDDVNLAVKRRRRRADIRTPVPTPSVYLLPSTKITADVSEILPLSRSSLLPQSSVRGELFNRQPTASHLPHASQYTEFDSTVSGHMTTHFVSPGHFSTLWPSGTDVVDGKGVVTASALPTPGLPSFMSHIVQTVSSSRTFHPMSSSLESTEGAGVLPHSSHSSLLGTALSLDIAMQDITSSPESLDSDSRKQWTNHSESSVDLFGGKTTYLSELPRTVLALSDTSLPSSQNKFSEITQTIQCTDVRERTVINDISSDSPQSVYPGLDFAVTTTLEDTAYLTTMTIASPSGVLWAKVTGDQTAPSHSVLPTHLLSPVSSVLYPSSTLTYTTLENLPSLYSATEDSLNMDQPAPPLADTQFPVPSAASTQIDWSWDHTQIQTTVLDSSSNRVEQPEESLSVHGYSNTLQPCTICAESGDDGDHLVTTRVNTSEVLTIEKTSLLPSCKDAMTSCAVTVVLKSVSNLQNTHTTAASLPEFIWTVSSLPRPVFSTSVSMLMHGIPSGRSTLATSVELSVPDIQPSDTTNPDTQSVLSTVGVTKETSIWRGVVIETSPSSAEADVRASSLPSIPPIVKDSTLVVVSTTSVSFGDQISAAASTTDSSTRTVTYTTTVLTTSSQQYDVSTPGHRVTTDQQDISTTPDQLLTTSLKVSSQSPPVLMNPVSHITAMLGTFFEKELAADMFHDAEDGDTRELTLTLTLPRDQPLPANFWLQLDPSRQVLFGLPLVADLDMGFHSVVVVATDSQGLGARNLISVYVNSSTFANFTHRFVMKFALDFGSFMRRRENVINLLQKIGSFMGDDSPHHITVVDVRPGSYVLSWTNSSLSGTRCQNASVHAIFQRMVRRDGTIRSAFSRHLGRKLRMSEILYQPEGVCVYRQADDASSSTTVGAVNSETDALTNILLPVVLAVLLLLLLVLAFFVYRCRQQRATMDTLDKDILATERSPVIFPGEIATSAPGADVKAKAPTLLACEHHRQGVQLATQLQNREYEDVLTGPRALTVVCNERDRRPGIPPHRHDGKGEQQQVGLLRRSPPYLHTTRV